MPGSAPILPLIQFSDAAGVPLASGTVTTYIAGSMTLAATYQDADLSIANENPIELDSSGQATIYLDPAYAYKFELKNAAGATVAGWPVDGISGGSVRDEVNAKGFGAIGDGVADDYAAIQAAIDYVEDAGGGTVTLGAGTFRLSAPLVIDGRGVRLVGAGNTAEGSTQAGGTQLTGDHNDGAVIRVWIGDTVLEGFTVGASADRLAGSAGTTIAPCAGIHIEGPDVAGGTGQVQRIRLRDITVIRQPSHGVIQIGESASAHYSDVYTLYNLGHGMAFDRGRLTGRTHEGAVGLITVDTCRGHDNGGHGIAAGQPADTGLPSYRVVLNNCEYYRNGSDAAMRYEDFGSFLYGQSITANNCAFGTPPASVVGGLGGLAVAGRMIRVNNCRYININQPAKVFWYTAAGEPSRDIFFDAMYISSPTYTPFANAVEVEAGATGVRAVVLADARGSNTTYVQAVTDDVPGYWTQDTDGIRADYAFEMRNFVSSPRITLADDAVQALTFDTASTAGIIAITCQSESNSMALIAYRVGTTPFCTILAAGADVVVGTGALTAGAGDGTDTKLNVFTHTDGKIYIKNRRGAVRDLRITMLGTTVGQLSTTF